MPVQREGNVYDSLRRAVLDLELMPGEQLSERGLEGLLGTSRTPIREALMRLENEGLVRRESRGWRVTPIDLAELRAVMEYREAVETAVVELTIERAQPNELRDLRALVESHLELDALSDDEATGMRDGSDFHLALARLSRNPFLVAGMTDALTRLSRTRWLEVRTAESRAQARAEHLAILDAIKAQDVARAQALVLAHSRGTRDRLLSALAEDRLRLRGRGLAIIESSTTPPPLAAA